MRSWKKLGSMRLVCALTSLAMRRMFLRIVEYQWFLIALSVLGGKWHQRILSQSLHAASFEHTQNPS